jgi:hypothetical protein
MLPLKMVARRKRRRKGWRKRKGERKRKKGMRKRRKISTPGSPCVCSQAAA